MERSFAILALNPQELRIVNILTIVPIMKHFLLVFHIWNREW